MIKRLLKKDGVTQSQTLLIMGIVFLVLFALIAVPFYNSVKKKSTVQSLKTVYSVLSQANRTYSLIHGYNANEYDTTLELKDFVEEYFTPYIQDGSFCKDNQSECWNKVQYVDLSGKKYTDKITYSIVLPSRAVVGFNKDKNGLISMIVDTNGKAGKNQLGRDVFIFSFYNNANPPKICENIPSQSLYIKNGIHFGGYDKCGVPFDLALYQDLFSKTLEDGCNKKAPKTADGLGVGTACLALVYKSSWTMDKKYPW